MEFEWYTHLCEYYNVTKEEALELGTRSTGRKPNLPGSITCSPVSEKTFEDIWDEKERKDTQSIFDFYKDQGAWSAFRQCVRHKDNERLHLSVLNTLMSDQIIKNGHICEYGCGVAPFITTMLKYIDSNLDFPINLTLVDVDCEHFNFAKYRLNDIKEKRNLKNVNLNFQTVTPEKLPDFSDRKLTAALCFEVLEHVPSPVETAKNMFDNMIEDGIYVENFIKHGDDDPDDGPDLATARKERNKYYNILSDEFTMLFPSYEESNRNPNCTRVWKKK